MRSVTLCVGFEQTVTFRTCTVVFGLLPKAGSRSIMVPLWVRHTEQRVAYLIWKLTWLSVFVVAKKSLIYWTNELK